MYKKSITKEEINALPMLEYEAQIELIENTTDALAAISKLKNAKVLGFDTETRPSFQKGEFYSTAILQLATIECAYLFRLNNEVIIPELFELLSNPNIIKTGVGIQDDVKGLQKLSNFSPSGFIDLSKEAEKRGFLNVGLRPLTAIFLQKRLSKAAKITNWERLTLTDAQIKYAANDARVGLLIYQKIIELP